MGGIYFLLPTLLVVFISFLVVKAATIALMMTGFDSPSARVSWAYRGFLFRAF